MENTMKKILITLIILLSAAFIAAQETDPEEKSNDNPPQTLISLGSDISFSGFGGPTVAFSKIGDSYSTLVGGRGGLIINGAEHGAVIGFSGSGMAYPNDREKLTGVDYTGTLDTPLLGYGGLLLQYHYQPKSLFHFAAGTTIGSGSFMYAENLDDDPNHHDNGDQFFYIEPELTAYINVTRFFRVGAGVSYRYSYGINSTDFKDSDFRNANMKLLFEFGWF